MDIITYIILTFLALQNLNLIINLIFKQNIRANNTKIKIKEDLISVLIPVRNEEENIGLLLSDLTKSNYNNLEIIVLDDESTDRTFQICKRFSKTDNRIKVYKSNKLAKNWLGKNYACHQLSEIAKGEYFLFLDSDVRIKSDLILDAVAYIKEKDLKLMSIFPTQIIKSKGEKLIIPIMNYILLSLLALIFVRKSPFVSHSAANGQFMLFDAETYKKYTPHKVFKSSAIEDILISRYYKKNRLKIACISSETRVQCRMYSSFKEAFNGFSKNIKMFFGNSYFLAFMFSGICLFGIVPILIYQFDYILIYFGFSISIAILYSLISKQNIILNTILFPIHQLIIFSLVINSILKSNKRKLIWKGRNIYSS
ncbi:MAG: glycosyltransferase family 2 protein [Marinifilaceae bacterium]|jgi:glycosyltransferase involved in cell wall biosynthesis|nr:glycosyltransferase family 2 protein [Marinifilaceae bacterium]